MGLFVYEEGPGMVLEELGGRLGLFWVTYVGLWRVLWEDCGMVWGVLGGG